MNADDGIIRDYEASDYEACESLVNETWGFDAHFRPQGLSDVAKRMYTQGSVIGSNFRRVIEVDGSTVGFLFGLNAMSARPGGQTWFGLDILRRILCIEEMGLGEKIALLRAIGTHEANRSKVVGRGKSEIVLFVISPEHRGRGYGRRLLSGFIAQCRDSGVESIVVETNALGAAGFYERAGFTHVGDFDSPLHEYVTRGGRPCMYEYRIE